MTTALAPDQLLATAKKLTAAKRRPRQSDLRRAVSTVYYAMFHALAKECADNLVGKSNRKSISRAWAQVYRNLDHRKVKDVCAAKNSRVKRSYSKFPPSIQAFGDVFCSMQDKRHSADYDPLMIPLVRSEVLADLSIAEAAIADFLRAPSLDRRAFCVFVMHDLRT